LTFIIGIIRKKNLKNFSSCFVDQNKIRVYSGRISTGIIDMPKKEREWQDMPLKKDGFPINIGMICLPWLNIGFNDGILWILVRIVKSTNN
jgi:hypothetical protein